MADLPVRVTKIKDGDLERILGLARRTGVFTPQEIRVIKELVQTELEKPEQSEYRSLVVEGGGQAVGFVCYGPASMTEGTYDLYWIFVDPDRQREGIGSALLGEVENAIRHEKGRMLLADTSSTPAYQGARRFYQEHGFKEVATVEDYYSTGDSRITYVKKF